MISKEKRIVVLCGGDSTEREVSLRSGKAVYNSLISAGYKYSILFDFNNNIRELLELKPDLVYLAMHGLGGEDGSVQGLLELANIKYTGPGIASSAIAMDKILTKKILCESNIPTANYCTAKSKEPIADVMARIKKKIGIPVVLKSPCQGSSIGVVIVKSEEKLSTAVTEVFEYGDDLLAEEYLSGTELTLPILGNDIVKVCCDIL